MRYPPIQAGSSLAALFGVASAMDMSLAAILGVFVIGVFWLLGGAAARAKLSHKEEQVRLPGKLAMEVGRSYAKAQPPQWKLWFVDAEVRYGVADRAWWALYNRSSVRTKVKMIDDRLALQKDIGEFIDPIECLKRLAEIARAGTTKAAPAAKAAKPEASAAETEAAPAAQASQPAAPAPGHAAGAAPAKGHAPAKPHASAKASPQGKSHPPSKKATSTKTPSSTPVPQPKSR